MTRVESLPMETLTARMVHSLHRRKHRAVVREVDQAEATIAAAVVVLAVVVGDPVAVVDVARITE